MSDNGKHEDHGSEGPQTTQSQACTAAEPTLVALSADIKLRPLLLPGLGLAKSIHIDEDESSLSSSGTELFEHASANSSIQPEKLRGREDPWRRYGSADSATSTGISSICSSLSTNDKSSDQATSLSPSKKRMADGSIKPQVGIPSSEANAMLQRIEQASNDVPEKLKSPPKRRGRPPKDKSGVAAAAPKTRTASMISQLQSEVRPRSAIPAHLPKEVFANQCVEAAQASRLDPYALHRSEHALLADLLMNTEVTIYLNIRNAILRLWMQNPLNSVLPEEAAGCAKDGRFYGLAEAAYKWLVRHGYINFGCVEVPHDSTAVKKLPRTSRQRTIVVIGAGVSGLTAARQLEGLVAQDSARWTDAGERPPKVVLLEGRRRIGGRVYSKQLRSQVKDTLPGNLRNTAEMGAMIVTGFEHGNPLDTVIRGQLGLHYHLMTDELTIYDVDGKPVDEHRDTLNTELYTDISDRAGDYRLLPQSARTLHGDEQMISRSRDPVPGGFENYQLEPMFEPLKTEHKVVLRRGRRRNAPPGPEKLTGRSQVVEESGASLSAARAAKTMGWSLKEGVARNQSISLHRIAKSSAQPALGTVMDEAIEQYQDMIDLTPQDMRLLNWHHANLEYANAAPITQLSLSGHDQDTGNEFEGAHSEIVGGYTQLPRGLMNLPTKLDVRLERVVESIHYDHSGLGSDDDGITTEIVCTDGEVFVADEVIMTAPLGVLKSDMIDFDPPLPGWKQGAIDRMGFGLLNKLVLLYDEPFWDDSRDMFGLLNEADYADSIDPAHYARKRGLFYLIWNASKISGRPMLVALLAGNAAHEAERTDTNVLLADMNDRLRKIFPKVVIPPPREVIVTRWKRDPFTRGTYSYVSPQTQAGDYDAMALPVGNLHFAGEATCGTHPATVHGAFLSGLRVAADVMDSMAGPIRLPTPLVLPPMIKHEQSVSMRPAQVHYAMYPGAAWSNTAISVRTAPSAEVPLTPASMPMPIIKQENTGVSLSSIPLATTLPALPARKTSGPPARSVCSADKSYWVSSSTLTPSDLNHETQIVGAIISTLGPRPPKPSRPGVNPFLLYTKANWERCKTEVSQDPVAMQGKDVIRQTLGKWWRALGEDQKKPYLEESAKAQEVADGLEKSGKRLRRNGMRRRGQSGRRLS